MGGGVEGWRFLKELGSGCAAGKAHGCGSWVGGGVIGGIPEPIQEGVGFFQGNLGCLTDDN